MKLPLYFIVFMVFVLLEFCSSEKTPLASTAHEDGWLDVNSNVFHAAKVQTIGAVSCRSCHGINTDSGENGTFCMDCHNQTDDASYPHPPGWAEFDSTVSHGTFVQNHDALTCNKCHGGENGIATGCESCH